MRSVFLLAGLIALAAANARGQAFEVASIRQDPPGKYIPSQLPLSGDDYYVGVHGGIASAHALLINYIIFAYKITDASQYPLLNAQLPKWAQTTSFGIEARAEGSPTKDQMRVMMRALLEDRFKLSMRLETRQLPYYALTLEKPGQTGPELQPHPDDGMCTARNPTREESTPPGKAPRPYCQPVIMPEDGLTHLFIMPFTMEQIAGNLGSLGVMLGGMDPLPVVDQTGLIGKYDFNIKFLRAPKGPQNSEAEPALPAASFVDALRMQAGLRLTKRTGPVQVFVVDHVEQPTEN
jgi:uncharacterized protein (TIGR03435 family)